jgi:hypothetical protein
MEKEELENEKEELLDLNKKEYAGAQKGVSEDLNAHLTCLDHYLDLFHLCNGKLCSGQEPINHTKLLRKWGYNFKGLSEHFSASSACARRGWWPETPTGFTPPGIPPLYQLMGCEWGVLGMWHARGRGS